jgi:hypothetical protein
MSSLRITLASLLFCSTYAIAEVSEISCHSAKNGVWYDAKISLSGGKIEGFSYSSMRKNGHTCEIEGSRSAPDVKWVDENKNKSIVIVDLLGDEKSEVSLQENEAVYTIEILSNTSRLCGIAGYISKKVSLSSKLKTCEVQE